jgi:hypothetical protein
MAIGKPRGKNGMRPVYVYDPRLRRKVYVGSRAKLRGPGGAQELEREKARELARSARVHDGTLTARAYAADWLELHHGVNTRRPAPSTRAANSRSLPGPLSCAQTASSRPRGAAAIRGQLEL